ncbi:uncharacterized protein LOC114749691 [Neltuma alba]|uniref:uncharacterized protein LOC114749691 n=1 Tax=Neltuma alba TaxID=207710 RepID=UPI0010A31FFC|nr:uncharacterized protein LOC114749691 [Prosopis alba]
MLLCHYPSTLLTPWDPLVPKGFRSKFLHLCLYLSISTMQALARSAHNGRHIPELLKRTANVDDQINHKPPLWMSQCYSQQSQSEKVNFLANQQIKEEEEEGQDKEQRTTLYQMDMFDFRTSHMFLVPLLAFLSINVSCFIGGLCRVVVFEEGNWEDMFLQILISGYVIVVNYPIIEGLLLRKDKGRVPTSVVPSFVALFVIIHLGFFLLLRIL